MKRSLFALALASAFACSAQAGELSYNYVEADYVNLDGDADGFGLRGSVNFGDSDFYGFGSWRQYDIDGISANFDHSEIGFGYHHGLSDKLDLIAELAYSHIDTRFGNSDGYRTSVGLRGAFSSKVEGLLKANYTKHERMSGDFTATAGLQFKLNPTWGITTEVEFDDHDAAYLLGLRASF